MSLCVKSLSKTAVDTRNIECSLVFGLIERDSLATQRNSSEVKTDRYAESLILVCDGFGIYAGHFFLFGDYVSFFVKHVVARFVLLRNLDYLSLGNVVACRNAVENESESCLEAYAFLNVEINGNRIDQLLDFAEKFSAEATERLRRNKSEYRVDNGAAYLDSHALVVGYRNTLKSCDYIVDLREQFLRVLVDIDIYESETYAFVNFRSRTRNRSEDTVKVDTRKFDLSDIEERDIIYVYRSVGSVYERFEYSLFSLGQSEEQFRLDEVFDIYVTLNVELEVSVRLSYEYLRHAIFHYALSDELVHELRKERF